MAVDERSRLELHRRLEDVLGPAEADTLMAHLPPVGWADVSTKHDLDVRRTLSRADLDRATAELRTEIGAMGADLRAEMAALGTDLRSEMAALGTDLRSEIGAVRVDVANLRVDVKDQSRQLVLTLVPVMVLINGIAVALVGLLR